MARPIRVQYPGAVYHIMSRGNEKRNIFKEDDDYRLFLKIFLEIKKRYNWQCFAYCLMLNHYHLFIKTNEANLSLGMRQLNGKYSQRFNINHERVGHLFQGRYKSVLVEDELYRSRLIRYITLNPLKAGLAKNLNDWKWNSNLEVMKEKAHTGCVDIVSVLKYYSDNKEEARKIYLEQINLKIKDGIDSKYDNGVVLGSEKFIESVKHYFKDQEREVEIPKKERLAFRPKLDEIFSDRKLSREERNELIYQAHIEYAYGIREIGGCVKLHYTSVSKIVKKFLELDA